MDDDPDAIAIVGVGCRLPGADNLEEFWRVLSNGENHVIDIPKDRWNVDAFYDANPDTPGKTNVRKVGIVKDHDKFDNRLFDMSEIEAAKMDPQQRFALEATFMAMEDGGFTKSQLNESKTGVYMGIMNTDYATILTADIKEADNYTLTGGAASIAAARISYVFNLLGPALVIDTACSSALIAIHLGSQALLTGDCNMAICGGVNCIMSPSLMIPMSKARMLSPTGISRAFSAEADGYARGEGCGIVILKKLREAEANGDKIWAIIKTASNQDGRMASPITTPSVKQQELLLKETYPRYGVDRRHIQVIEAHGTGTPVGDPAEANSLGSFFGEDGTLRFIGSVKTNIGHLEAAAGIAGLIKVLLMMKKAIVVPSLHFVNPNPEIDFAKFNFKVPTECYPWEPLADGRRMACVNSFGFGGSNGHAIVIQPPSSKKEPTTNNEGHKIIAISGHSKAALKANVTHLLKSLAVVGVNPERLSYTSTCRRHHYNNRLAVPISEGDDLVQTLKPAQGSFDKIAIAQKDIQLVYVFGGMGTTWDGMCKEIMCKEKRFLLKVREIDRILKKYCTVSVEDELHKQTNYTDPMIGPLILFSCQVALFAVWEAWGVKPYAIIGQSVGEVAAAYASGRLSLDDSVMVIFYRTELLAKATGGKMIVILNNPVSEVEERCAKYDGRLNVALYYSPSACAVSGDDDCVNAIETEIQRVKQRSSSDISCIQLNVTTAFHSQRMESLMSPLEQKIKGIKASEEQTKIFSTVTGKIAEGTDFVTPKYWAQNVRKPVLFHQALLKVRDNACHTVFIEIGPKPVLRHHFEDIFGDDDGVQILSSMEEGCDMDRMLKSLCELYAIGFDPTWEKIIPQSDREITDEPKYQFQRTKLFYEPGISRRYRDGTEISIQDHPFVNRVSGDIPTFRVTVNEQLTPFVFEHFVNGVILVPGAFYAEVALVVGSEVLRMPPQTLTIGAQYIHPLSVQPGQEYILTCQVQNVTSTSLSFTVYKQNSIYAHGHAEKRESKLISTIPIVSKIKSRCKSVQNHDEIYRGLAQCGFNYGDTLSILQESFSNNTETLVTLQFTNSQMYQTHFHPSVLDAMTQAISTITGEGESNPFAVGKQALPAGIGSLTLGQSLEKHMLCYVKLMNTSGPKFSYNVLLMTATGNLVAEVKDIVIQIVGKQFSEVERISYKLDWMPVAKGRATALDGTEKAIVIRDDSTTLNDFVGISEKLTFTCGKTSSHNLDIEEVKNSLFITDSSDTLIVKKEVVAIVFDQGNYDVTEETTPGDIFSTICQTCNNLRELLLFMSEYNMSVPVTILTRATQSLSDKSNDDVVNIFGSQLWGMVRSVIKEYLYPYVQLLDISDTSPETLATLEDHITDVNITDNLGKEILIRQGEAYTSIVIFLKQAVPSLLAVEQKWNGKDEVRIVQRSDQHTDLCLYHSHKSQPENGHVRIFVQSVLLHKESIFPTTMAGKSQIWKNITSNEPQLICLEAQGYQETFTDREKKIILCLPVGVSNIVNVPKECIVQHSAVPCYKVGLMTLLLFAWQIYETVDKQSRTIFVIDDSSKEFAKRMKDILFLFGIENTECVLSACIHNTKLDKNTALIILADLENQELDRVAVASELKQIIGIEGYNGFATFESCFLKHITAQLIPIEAKQVFHLSRIKKNLHKILSKISEKRDSFEELFSQIKQEHFAWFSHGSLDLDQPKVMTTAESLFRKNASYLVVGGLGGIGWLTVRLIAEMGGGLIATLSRSLPSEDMGVKIENLKQDTGVDITCLQADICDEISLQNAFNRLSKEFPRFPLKGIFQGAGVLEDAFLEKMTRENFDRVCKPKILGTYNLHKISLNYDLDYFVMHSSIASIAGNAGQTNYASGNSFMDTFAYHRRSKGLPGQAINWGPLEVGMASSEQILQLLLKNGFVPLTEGQIKSCLVYSLLTSVAQICYMDFDWIEKQHHHYFDLDIRPVIMNKGLGKDGDDSYQFDLAAIKILPSHEIFDAILVYLKEVIGKVLPMYVEVQKETELSTLGLDSMSVMTLVNQIRTKLNVRMTGEKLMSMNTVDELVHFCKNLILSQSNGEDECMVPDSVSNVSSITSEMSFLQDSVLQRHLKWNGERDIVMCAEVEIKLPETPSQPVEWMREVIITVLERHESLRTIFIAERKVTRPRVLDRLSDVTIIPLQSNDPQVLTKEISKLSKRPFDLSKEIPIRVVCGYAKGQLNVGFVFHSICFDLKSIQLFFKDFSEVAKAQNSKSDLQPQPKINVPYEIETALSPKMKDMESFWNTKINMHTRVPLISFSDEDTKSEDVFGFKHFVKAELLKKSSQLSQWKVTQFQFLTSAYHLLLHFVSGKTKVGLRTVVDIRMHVPRLRDAITCCGNAIPLVSEINPINSIQHFVKTNATEISRCVSNGLYPRDKIMEKTTAETTANIYRHCIVSEDMTEMHSTTQGLDFVTFKSNGGANMACETRLLIWSKKDDENLLLQLDYLPSLITKSKAENLLRDLSGLVNYMVLHPQEPIENIPTFIQSLRQIDT